MISSFQEVREFAMKIFVTGGTGFVGRNLVEAFIQEGHDVTVLARSVRPDRTYSPGVAYLEGDPTQEGAWQNEVLEHDVIVNLAGASIFTRWTKSAKAKILDSRILTTRHLVNALSRANRENTILLSTSAVGYYGFHEDEELDEAASPGNDFLATVCRDWEAEALKAEASGIRVVLLRFGIVLGKEGGALRQMLPLFKRSMGSPLGSGRQWFSWIHLQDLIRIFLSVLKENDIRGPVNCTSPNSVRNRDFTKALGEALGKSTFMPAVPGLLIKVAMGEFGSVLLKGQRAVPKVLLSRGFVFRFPEIGRALQDLVS